MKDLETLVKLDEMLWFAENGIKPDMKDIPGYEGEYAATRDGQIWSHKSQIYLKHYINKKGYHLVSLSKNGKAKTCRVHRLVALTWIPNPDNLPQVSVSTV